MLTQRARKKFKIVADPFTGDVTKAEDVYMTDDTRFVSEYLYQTARIGGMVALIGESGSGKTTIRRYAIDRMQAEGQKVRVIIPRCIDKTKLTATSICDAIIQDCSEEHPKRTLEAKARQIERILTNSSRSGWSHVLMIEEAHDLHVQTLKYLKRFWELEDGFKKLLAIVLIGQPEMKGKLDEAKNWEAREVIRRMEVLELSPLSNGKEIAAYLDIKFSRLDRERKTIIDDEACEALAIKLRRQTRNQQQVYSVAYPLLVNNWTRKAMNLAAELGSAIVDADVVNSL
ncbi:AAA family ATPase [Treponema denticola]|uniref:ExeA family protein n=1 Tax=Treponema denticola TaxID=158 RepID=UPI0021F91D79|nr:AAA family ATPase [Treponema denticola]UYT08178.1 AAA family ATPase [Treponema denticola]